MIRFHALHDLRRYTIPQSMLGPGPLTRPDTETSCAQCTAIRMIRPCKPGTRPGRRCRLQYVTDDQALPRLLAKTQNAPPRLSTSPIRLAQARSPLRARAVWYVDRWRSPRSSGLEQADE